VVKNSDRIDAILMDQESNLMRLLDTEAGSMTVRQAAAVAKRIDAARRANDRLRATLIEIDNGTLVVRDTLVGV
jgi:hypothetical protein